MENALDVKSNARGLYMALRSLALYALLLFVGFYFDNIYLWIVLWILGSFLFSTFFSLLHWSIHGSLFRSSILNDVFGRIFATLSIDVCCYYKYWHYIHHDQTNEEGDAEGFHITSLSSYVKALLRYFLNHYTRFVDYYQTLFANTENRQKYYEAHRTEFFFDTALLIMWVYLLIGLTYFFPVVMLKAYFMPILFSLPLLFFLDLAEHYGTQHNPDSPYSATRTIIGNAFTRFLTAYSNYHLEHHLNPTVSYFHMQDLREELLPKAPYKAQSYFAFHLALLKELARK